MSINKQTEILNSLVQIMHNSALTSYDELMGEFDFSEYEDGFSVGYSAKLKLNLKNHNLRLLDENDNISHLIEELHNLMKAHTGGSWTSFNLTLSAEGKVTTKFNYNPIEE